MAVDAFLKIDGVEGESDDLVHRGEIEVESWKWGAQQPGTSAFGKGSGAGRVDMQDFRFFKRVDKSSPRLYVSCCSGQVFQHATLSVRKAGTTPQDYLKVYFTNVMIAEFQTAGCAATDDVPREQIKFDFGKVEFEYRIQKPDGSMGGPLKGGYDLQQNVKI